MSGVAFFFLALALGPLPRLATALNALLLGETEAAGLGIGSARRAPLSTHRRGLGGRSVRMNRETTPPLDVLMAASLYLMTRYAEEKCPETAVALAQHLQWIAEHPECARSPLANASAHLSQRWHRLARRTSLL